MEDDNGVTVARMKDNITIKCLERMFSDKTTDSPRRSSCGSTSLESPINQNLWEFYLQEIEDYLQELLSSNLEEGSYGKENYISQISPVEEPSTSDNTVTM